MNILELCLSSSLGGLELYMVRSADFLSKTDSVFSVIDDSGMLKPRFEKAGLPFITEKPTFRAFPYVAAKRLARLIDDHNIDVIHMHWGKDLPIAAMSKRFSKKKPRLIYTRQMKMTRSKDDFYHNFFYAQMNLMLTITDKLASEAKRFLSPRDAAKVARLYYGVDAPAHFLERDERQRLRRTLGIDETVFLAGLFGRIEEVKGQYLIIEALACAKQEGIPIHGLIVGQAMEEAYLKALKGTVKQLGLDREMMFKDFVDDPQTWMQVCDCVVLATHEETFGLVLVEAMRAGVPVIGSDSGGVPEIIEDEKNGLLFESANSEQLYRCLSRYKNDRDSRKNIALAGKQKADGLFASEAHFRMLRKYMEG